MAVKLGNGNWAVKEDKLLAYNDNSGLFFNKEFDFSRGTSATYVAKDGLIKTAGIQPNVVTNGDFSDGSTNWTLGTDWTVADGKATYGGNANGNALTQSNLFTVSGRYRVKFTISDIASGNGRIYMSNADLSEVYLGLTYVSNQSYSFDFDATATNDLVIRGYTSGGGQSFSISNITVQQIETDTPRIDFTNETKGHLLLEPQRTNSLPYSEDFTQWIVQSGTTITSNTTETLSPSGQYNASKIVSNGSVGFYKIIAVTGVVSRSIYLKSVTGTVNVKLKDPQKTVTTKTLSVTENWQRFELVESNGHASLSGLWIDDIPSSGIYAWGAQVEQGDYSTSYIPTTGAASTRNADVCNNSGSAQDFNSEEGVLYAEIASLANDLTNRQISINNGTTTDRVQLFYSGSSNQISVFYKAQNGTTQFSLYETLSDITEFNKIAFKWKTNDFALWINGIETDTVSSGVTSTANSLTNLDFNQFNGGADFYGKVRNVQVFTEALTDEQLEKLTS